jgi:hypothetical protein
MNNEWSSRCTMVAEVGSLLQSSVAKRTNGSLFVRPIFTGGLTFLATRTKTFRHLEESSHSLALWYASRVCITHRAVFMWGRRSSLPPAAGAVEGVHEVLILTILNSRHGKIYITHCIYRLNFACTSYRDEHNGEVFVFKRLFYQIYYT